MSRVRHFLLPFAAVSALTMSAAAKPVDLAEDDSEALDPKSSEQQALEAEADPEKSDAKAEDAEAPADASAEEERNPTNEPPGGQWVVGARFRMGITPKFLINWFGVEGGTTLVTPGGGVEFGHSSKDFEILGALGWQSYAMSQTWFRMPNETEKDFFTSKLGLFTIEADLAWKFPIAPNVTVPIGVGLGAGVVTGQLTRTESYAALDGSPLPCSAEGFGAPGVLNGECESTALGGKYGPEAPWPVYPIVDFRTGVRWQAHRHFIGRFDLGLGSTGFWFGLGADYGI
jgi:hypothetical protein